MAVFTIIDHEELSGTTATYDVTSIPASYDHLYLTVSARSDNVSYRDAIYCKVNNDSGSNYTRTNLFAGDSTSPSSYGAAGATIFGDFMDCVAASALADTFNAGTLWIPNYANTANFKQLLARSGSPNNDNTNYRWGLQCVAGLWSSTAAIDQLTLSLQNGDFVQHSSFTLYGVTGA